MSFRRYLDENRSLFADHRVKPPGPGIPLDEDAAASPPLGTELPTSGGGLLGRRRGRDRSTMAPRGRFRHISPVLAPSIWHEPLPYEEPLERVFR